MGPLFTAQLSKFSRQPLDPVMPFPVPPGIIGRHARECGDFFLLMIFFHPFVLLHGLLLQLLKLGLLFGSEHTVDLVMA